MARRLAVVVAAVDAAAGEVDADVAVFKLGDPLAYGDTVPGDDAPRRWVWSTAENGDGVAAGSGSGGRGVDLLVRCHRG